jgi:GDP-4-dehydro-6-deoxy-D-mannose reductase
MEVGNLGAVRDFVDVRDCVEALVLVAERGAPGESYNVCTGTGNEVSAVVKALQAASNVPFQIIVDPARFRPIDDLRIVGSPQKLLALGHSRRYELARTAGDTLAALRGTLSRKET